MEAETKAGTEAKRGNGVPVKYRVAPFTPQDKAILGVLADGQDHALDELWRAAGADEYNSRAALKMAISRLRKKLKPAGQDIVCVCGFGMRRTYRQVRLLGASCG